LTQKKVKNAVKIRHQKTEKGTGGRFRGAVALFGPYGEIPYLSGQRLNDCGALPRRPRPF